MKKLMALGILTSSFAFADQPSEITSIMQVPAVEQEDCEEQDVLQIEVIPVKAAYGYVSLGLMAFPYPVPLVGVGGRYQKGHHGVDGSIQFMTNGRQTLTKGNINYLYYFKPNLASQFYLGGGLGSMQYWRSGDSRGHGHLWGISLSPQLVFGKQYKTKALGVHYIQMLIDPVFFYSFPCVTLSYGFCF